MTPSRDMELHTYTCLDGNTDEALPFRQEDSFIGWCCSAEDASYALWLHPHTGLLQQRGQGLLVCKHSSICAAQLSFSLYDLWGLSGQLNMCVPLKILIRIQNPAEAGRTVPAGCAPIQANRWRTKGSRNRTEATTPSMGPGMPE